MRSLNAFRPIANCVFSAIVFLSLHPSAEATPPSINKLFKTAMKSKILDRSSLELQAEHGPWLILAGSFDGEDAESQAMELAQDLRKNYGMNAYLMPKKFDYTQTVAGAGFSPNGNALKMKYQDQRQVLGYGVLIGDFDSLEHPRAKEVLRKVKLLQPKSLTGKEDQNIRKWIPKKEDSSAPAGPLAAAFLTKNPLLPDDYFQPPKVDKFVKQLNQSADHSLLEAKGNFTVRVAIFRGADSLYLDRNSPENKDHRSSDGLVKATEHAHLAASVLRTAGYDAFEFHDRNNSIVTVGQFDQLGKSDGEGAFVYDAAIQSTVREFGGAKEFRNSALGPVPVAKTLLDLVSYKKIPDLNKGSDSEKKAKVRLYSIPFDIEPKPMAIPRPETTGLYSGSLLGKR